MSEDNEIKNYNEYDDATQRVLAYLFHVTNDMRSKLKQIRIALIYIFIATFLTLGFVMGNLVGKIA